MRTFNSLPEEKKDKLLRLMFNPREYKNATQPHKVKIDIESKNGDVYECPKCGHKDHTLAEWRKFQSSQEKWEEGLMKWYQKKKCQHQLAKTKEPLVTNKSSRTELFSKLNRMSKFSDQVQEDLNKSLGCDENQSKSDCQSPGGVISPSRQNLFSKLDAMKIFSQQVQEKLDAQAEEDGNQSFLNTTRNSGDENCNQSELRENPNRTDSLHEDLSMSMEQSNQHENKTFAEPVFTPENSEFTRLIPREHSQETEVLPRIVLPFNQAMEDWSMSINDTPGIF